MAAFGERGKLEATSAAARKGDWVVYTKPPFGGARQVLKYLARYTHQGAISNQRLICLEEGKVRFRWKDYRNGNRQRTMTLDAVEFLRRFLLHVLPKGFMRIRYYGFMANPAYSGKGENRPLPKAPRPPRGDDPILA